MNLKGIVNAIATVGWALVKIVLEITPFLRTILPRMAGTWDEIEAMVHKGGIAADDYITAHTTTFEGFVDLGDDLIALGGQLKVVASMTLAAAAPPDTPGEEDLVTVGEAQEIFAEIGKLKDLLLVVGNRADAAHPMLLSMAQAGPGDDPSKSPTLA